jgi:hypothetical protein
MTTTTDYGTWLNYTGGLTVEQTVADFLGDYSDDFDVDAIVREYRDTVDRALPAGVNLCGNEFIGPYYEKDQDFGDAPLNDLGGLDIAAIVAAVDLEAICCNHDVSAT